MHTSVLLREHRDNLAGAANFEEYRRRQLAYIDKLIEKDNADAAKPTLEWRSFWKWLFYREAAPTWAYKIMVRSVENLSVMKD